MKKTIWSYVRRDKTVWIVGILFILGLLLRFWKLPEFVTFLGDQGRDAIIIKRIVTLEHFPAIGPPTSIGQVFLGPFYYYFISPWLFLARFNPIGPAIGVAVFSTLFIAVMYFVVKDFMGRRVALIAAFFTAFSAVLIEYSRFSWNPNLLPLFSLLSGYFLLKATQSKRALFFFLAGSFLSLSIQLHYLALFLLPPAALVCGFYLGKNKKILKNALLHIASLMGGFILFASPLILFDLRHGFINAKSFLALFEKSGGVGGNMLQQFFESFTRLNEYLFFTKMSPVLLAILLVGLSVFFLARAKIDPTGGFIFLFLVFALCGPAFFAAQKIPHYFFAAMPFYIIAISLLLGVFLNSLSGLVILGVFMILFLFFNAKDYRFLKGPGSNPVKIAQDIARVISDNVSSPSYQVTALPHQYSDGHYRYFLEIWGKRPLEKDSLERASELFVICEEPCRPIGNPQWDIAFFAPRVEVGAWKAHHVTIYKLKR